MRHRSSLADPDAIWPETTPPPPLSTPLADLAELYGSHDHDALPASLIAERQRLAERTATRVARIRAADRRPWRPASEAVSTDAVLARLEAAMPVPHVLEVWP